MSKHIRDWSPDAPAEKPAQQRIAKPPQEYVRFVDARWKGRRAADRASAMQREMEAAR